jgi:hypothetical protein
MENLKNQIVMEINEMNQGELVTLSNIYSREIVGDMEGEIFENEDEFFDIFFDGKVVDAIRSVCYGDYRYSDNLVKFNGYGNLESFNYMSVKQLCELPETMAEDIFNNFNEFQFLFSSELNELINQVEIQ